MKLLAWLSDHWLHDLEHGHGLARDHTPPFDQPGSPRLPTVEIGKRDLSLEAHSVQDLEAVADVPLLWDVRDKATAEESRGEARGWEIVCLFAYLRFPAV